MKYKYKTTIKSLALVLCALTGNALANEVKLVAKPVTQFDWIYDDHDTGANGDISIWRPNLSHARFNDGNYYSLGDVAMNSHGTAPKMAIAVKAVAADALAPPTGYVKVWDDSGSGGSHDVIFWKPVAPSGYTCLGDVAIRSYSQSPDTNWIRCVKTEYLRSGSYQKIWDDSGSGADDDAGVWQATPASGDEAGLAVNTFISRGSHNVGGQQFFVLDKQKLPGLGFSQQPSSDADWAALAKSFAPLVYLHQDDEFLPSSVPHFTPNTSPFSGYNGNITDNNGYLTTGLSCAICTNQTFLYGQNPESASVPVYASIITKNSPATSTGGIEPSDTVTDIVYWMFYPYNRGKWINPILWDTTWYGNHVGDWEHLTVRFVNGYPYQVYLSQHGDGSTYMFGDKNLMLTGTSTGEFGAQVYSAKGSHALYAFAGSYTYQSINIVVDSIDLTDHTSQGKAWHTSNNVEVMFYRTPGQYTGDFAWMNYTGRWDNSEQACISTIGVCRLEDGPTGPIRKNALNPGYFNLD
ncbi:Vps62-related protein [Thalassomonas viridans]|uniref:Vps62-related protein n=1 Tax=Thalassomonas viridans TaxID=137584 RepID=A0AAF0C7J0_9GAMM|nr:Vps62-related protein [Thalassomonas viridans]WDE03225.1 Vps62-related protein [Thalassomonas viridans]